MSERLRFTIAPGALSALGHAGQHDPGYSFLISGGDLGHMGTQYEFLRNQGFDVGRRDVYPAMKSQADYDKAITAIWSYRVAGWWNLSQDLYRLELCTKEEFSAALDSQIEKSR